jgi:hypothetical protein
MWSSLTVNDLSQFQVERRFLTFYLPKLILVGSLWVSAMILTCWQKLNATRDPTYNFEMDTVKFNVSYLTNGFSCSSNNSDWCQQNLKNFFIVCGVTYLLALVYLMFKAYSELRSMPYFGQLAKS